MRLTLRNRTLGLLMVTGLITLTLVVTLVYAASDNGTTDNVVWSYWVGSLAYSGATQETDTRHSYYVRNNTGAEIQLGWEFSHKVLMGNTPVFDGTEWDQGDRITLENGESYSKTKLLRKYVQGLTEDVEYTLKAYTAVRIYDENGVQMFGKGDNDDEEITFMP